LGAKCFLDYLYYQRRPQQRRLSYVNHVLDILSRRIGDQIQQENRIPTLRNSITGHQ